MNGDRFVKFMSVLLLVAAYVALSVSCEHSPAFMDDDDMIPDTTGTPGDTTKTGNPMDSTKMDSVPCDPDIVYFDLQILPILQSNCAFSGCHDAASAEDGVILDSYDNVMLTADVEEFNLDDSEIYEVLVDDDEDERMPPAPGDRLAGEQIQLIAKWILQGATREECTPGIDGCDTEDVSFSAFVQPVIVNSCQGCHSGTAPSGNIDLSDHAGVQKVAADGRLLGAISWDANYKNMPQGGNKLPDCTIDKIAAWITDGAPNN